MSGLSSDCSGGLRSRNVGVFTSDALTGFACLPHSNEAFHNLRVVEPTPGAVAQRDQHTFMVELADSTD